MKGIGLHKDVITEVLAFGNQKRINEIKAKFQEKYGKDLVAEIKSETSGYYQKIVLRLWKEIDKKMHKLIYRNVLELLMSFIKQEKIK